MNPSRLPEPIAAMSAEHQYILAALSDLATLTKAGVFNPLGIAEALQRLITLLEAHVNKEETLLFPAIREALGDDASAMELLETEHKLLADLRQHLHSLSTCFDERALTVEDIDGLAVVVKLAADTLQPHIFKEDYVLYPLAGQIISKDKLCELTVRLETRGNG